MINSNRMYIQYMYSYPHKTAYRPIDAHIVQTYLKQICEQDNSVNVYIHIPFCTNKCGYCNLFSIAGYDKNIIEKYIDALERQIIQYGKIIGKNSFTCTSLTFGGGSPSVLSIKNFDRIFEILNRELGVNPHNVESAIELSPNETSKTLVEYLKSVGFKRISIGIQSFIEEELQTLGRKQTSVNQALSYIVDAGFKDFNIDLIYGIPGQTIESFQHSLEKAISYTPTELFVYPLYIRQGTPLFAKHNKVDEQLMISLYKKAIEFLNTYDFCQTSMRRFTKDWSNTINPVHDYTDCGFERVLSLGCGGRSYLGNLHMCEPYTIVPLDCKQSLNTFIDKQDFLSGLSGFMLDEDEHKRRYIIKNLLHVSGMSMQLYKELFKSLPQEDFPFIDNLIQDGLLYNKDEMIILTPNGLALSDCIGHLFISRKVSSFTMIK